MCVNVVTSHFNTIICLKCAKWLLSWRILRISQSMSSFLLVYTFHSIMYLTSGAVISQSCTTSLIHRSGSIRKGKSSIHKWNQKQNWNERLIWGYHCRGPLKANAFHVLIPTVIRTSAPQTHLLPVKLIESYWLYAEAGREKREREKERKWQDRLQKWSRGMKGKKEEVKLKDEQKRRVKQSWAGGWGAREWRGKRERETGKEQIALPPC